MAAVLAPPAPVPDFMPPFRAGASQRLGASGLGAVATLPTDLRYGTLVGIRSCCEQRYIAAYPKAAAHSAGSNQDQFELEVSGYHPFRQGDATGRATDFPSEWLLLHFNSRQHQGPVRLGDEVCFVKEIPGTEKRRYRYVCLALGPTADGEAMEPVVERLEAAGDLCKWTLVHADGTDGLPTGTALQPGSPVLLKGKYNECLSLGRPLWDSGPGESFRSPSRACGRALVCRGRDGLLPELRFRIVRAGIPFGPDPGPGPPIPPRVPPPPLRAPEVDGEGLGRKTLRDQEQLLLEDVLYALLGADSVYIRRAAPVSLRAEASASGAPPPPSLPEAHFEVDAPLGTDASTVQFLSQLLPLCEHHAAVQFFVEVQGRPEFGAVNQALCAAIRELLGEFSTRVSQLELLFRQGELSIAKLWYHAQPSLDALALLHRVAAHIYGKVGGEVLNGIEEVMARTSLLTAQELCEHLLQQSSRPYLEMVSCWVYDGRLEDPYREFFVSESKRQVRNERIGGPAADFWQKHFLLDERAVPVFLAASKEKVLHAGKYLHVFFSAAPGKTLPEPVGGRAPFHYSRRRRDYDEAVDAAFRRASAALLGLFMKLPPEGLDLPGRLRSMRNFFFLGRADWFGQFMDTAFSELERPAEEVPITRLEGLLDLAVRTSSAAADPYREDISCGLHSFRIEEACQRMTRGNLLPIEEVDEDAASVVSHPPTPSASSTAPPSTAAGFPRVGASGPASSVGPTLAADDGTGVRCMTLKYRTSWPLSIFFSKVLLLKYQVIFRHLLYCRYVERKLVEVWVDHQNTKELGLDSRFSPFYSLRQRMLHFCRDYIYYVTVEVLEPQSHRFLASLSQADSIDHVMDSHEQFLDTCLREVLLTEREGLYRHLSKVLTTCLAFTTNLRQWAHSAAEDPTGREDNLSEVEQSLTPAERRLLRVQQSTQTHLKLLCHRQYTKMIQKFKVIFESQLQGFLRQIQHETTARYEHFLSNLATRLDYNEYYSSVLANDDILGGGRPPPTSDLDVSRMTASSA